MYVVWCVLLTYVLATLCKIYTYQFYLKKYNMTHASLICMYTYMCFFKQGAMVVLVQTDVYVFYRQVDTAGMGCVTYQDFERMMSFAPSS